MEVDESTSEEGSRCSSRASNIAGRGSSLGRTSPVVLSKPLGSGRFSGAGEFAVPNPPSHPSKLMLSARRSSSGIFLSNMFSSRFRHLQKLHTDAFLLGLNAVSYPGLPTGTMFRSSLPATPVSTPIHREPFHHFTEQALNERLCKTPSPRKNRGFSPHSSYSSSQQSHQHQTNEPIEMSDNDSTCSDQHQPMDTTSPIPPSQLDDTLTEAPESTESSPQGPRPGQDNPKESCSSSSPQQDNLKKLFVKNLGYNKRVSLKKMSAFYRKFFEKFGEVEYFYVVEDHVKKISRGFGFVCFRNIEGAEKALKATPEELAIDLTSLLGSGALKPQRILQVFPSQRKFMSRVREDVKTTKEAQEEILKEREELIGKIISGEIKREPITEETEEQDHIMTPIQKLTDDLLLLIISRLDNLRDWINCELVCKRWSKVVKKAWSTCNTLVLAKTFYIFNAPPLNKENLFLVLRKCPCLKVLNLEKVSNELDEVSFQLIAECCPALEQLVFSGANLTAISLKYLAEHCPNLKAVDLSSCRNLTEKNLWEFLHIANTLEVLHVSGNSRITGKCFYNLKKLKELDLRWCQMIHDDAFSKLAQKNSESLQILRIGPISLEATAFICENFKNITSLTIEYLTCDTQGEYMRHLSKLNNLESFVLECHMTNLKDDTFIEFMKSCPKLKKLHLSAASSALTDQSVSLIPNYCSKIISLQLVCAGIKDQSLYALATLGKIESLVIRGTYVTDDGLRKLFDCCPNLWFLDVNRCPMVTHRSFYYAYDLIHNNKLSKKMVISFNDERFILASIPRDKIRECIERFDESSYSDDDDTIYDDDILDDEFFDEEEELS